MAAGFDDKLGSFEFFERCVTFDIFFLPLSMRICTNLKIASLTKLKFLAHSKFDVPKMCLSSNPGTTHNRRHIVGKYSIY